MKFIFFIFDIFCLQKYGGISKYIFEISKDITIDNKKIIKLPFVHFNINAKSYNLFIDIKKKILKKIIFFINHLVKKILLIFFKNYVTVNSYFEKNLKNSILIVYDLIPELISRQDFNKEFLKSRRNAIKKSKIIISISKKTKKDLVNFYKIDKKKIIVIYPGGFSKEILTKKINYKLKTKIPKNYFLYVGNRSGYKNFEIIMQVSKIFKEKKRKEKFVVYGGGDFSEFEKNYMYKNKINKYFCKLDGDEETLFQLYKNAFCLIYPSKYEGFGIPVVESFQCGCPVITTKKGSLQEAGGNAAIYFNPQKPNDLIKSIDEMKKNREYFIRMGYLQAKKFSWEKSRAKFKSILLNI